MDARRARSDALTSPGPRSEPPVATWHARPTSPPSPEPQDFDVATPPAGRPTWRTHRVRRLAGRARRGGARWPRRPARRRAPLAASAASSISSLSPPTTAVASSGVSALMPGSSAAAAIESAAALGVAALDVALQRARPRPRRLDLQHRGADQLRLAGDALEVRARRGAEPLVPRAVGAGRGLRDQLQQLVARLRVQREEARLLVGEVLVEGALGHAGVARRRRRSSPPRSPSPRSPPRARR